MEVKASYLTAVIRKIFSRTVVQQDYQQEYIIIIIIIIIYYTERNGLHF